MSLTFLQSSHNKKLTFHPESPKGNSSYVEIVPWECFLIIQHEISCSKICISNIHIRPVRL